MKSGWHIPKMLPLSLKLIQARLIDRSIDRCMKWQCEETGKGTYLKGSSRRENHLENCLCSASKLASMAFINCVSSQVKEQSWGYHPNVNIFNTITPAIMLSSISFYFADHHSHVLTISRYHTIIIFVTVGSRSYG
jgi:hypothetical protein